MNEMRRVQFKRDGNPLIHYELMEIQGKLETRPTQNENLKNHFVGTLSRDGKKCDLIIEKKKLMGKESDLRRPLVVVKKVGENRYQITSILKNKLMFRRRPTPWEMAGMTHATPATPMTPVPFADFVVPSPAQGKIRSGLVSNQVPVKNETEQPKKPILRKKRRKSYFDKWIKKKK